MIKKKLGASISIIITCGLSALFLFILVRYKVVSNMGMGLIWRMTIEILFLVSMQISIKWHFLLKLESFIGYLKLELKVSLYKNKMNLFKQITLLTFH